MKKIIILTVFIKKHSLLIRKSYFINIKKLYLLFTTIKNEKKGGGVTLVTKGW